MRLAEDVGTIRTRDDFVHLVRELLHELDNEPDTWENADLASFLNALAAWVEDMDGYYRQAGEPVPEQPTWKTLGQMLLAARVYE